MSPTFSIITVCYNAAATLPRTLASVAAQRYRTVEYIIIDGGSKDGTLGLVEQYRGIVSQLVSEPDGGIYDAMNKGLSLATGDYVCFLNAGDTFHSTDTLSSLAAEAVAAEMPDVLYGDTDIVDSEGHFLRHRRLTPPAHLTWRSFRMGMLVCHQAFYAKRSLAVPNDLRYRLSADFDWCVRILKTAQRTHHTHLVLADYLSEGMTTRHHKASLLERFQIMRHHYGLPATLLLHALFLLRSLLRP